MSTNFRYQPFVAVFGNHRGKIPVVDNVLWSHDQKIYPFTQSIKNCTKFEFQAVQTYYVDLEQTYSALKLKFVKNLGYETYKTKKVEKEHKEKAKADQEETELQFLSLLM